MTHWVTERLTREWLRSHAGKTYCSECIAREFRQEADPIRAIVSQLVFAQHAYWAGHCDCGKRGVKHSR